MDRRTRNLRRRGILITLMLAALFAFGLMSASAALADPYCESCHKAGGLASDPARHPIPPVPAWDTRDGQCVVCHEMPGFQTAPHGPYVFDRAGGWGDHEWMYDGYTHCTDCHWGELRHPSNTSGTYIQEPMVGTLNLAGSDCSGCHASGMSLGEPRYDASAVPQIDPATHGDPGTAHDAAVSAECADCHGTDLVGMHPACSTCHGAVPVASQNCVSCHPTYTPTNHGFPLAGGRFTNPGYNGGDPYEGYLDWKAVETFNGSDLDSPHGNYTTSTNKCAVCHSVHRADSTGIALTAWGGVGTTGLANVDLAPFESCYFCHGNAATFTDKIVEFAMTDGGHLSPHTTCARCHTASPHGAGASQYPILSAKLINDGADELIAFDLANGNNGLQPAMFDMSDPALAAQGMTLGTGYLCASCHPTTANPAVFAVNEPGATLALQDPATGVVSASSVTGHMVWTGTMTHAFNDAAGCGACHDALRADGQLAFPHGYVDAAGAPAPSGKDTGAAYLWMTAAGDADDPKSIVTDTQLPGALDLTNDGTCLKCHLSGDRTEGVGVTY